MISKLNLRDNIIIDVGDDFYLYVDKYGSHYADYGKCNDCNYSYICTELAKKISIHSIDLRYLHDCFKYHDGLRDFQLNVYPSYSKRRLLIGDCIKNDISNGGTS